MAMGAFPAKCVEPEVWIHTIRMLGTGASAPTLEEGAGVTITRTGVGDYTVTWDEDPGVFVGAWATLAAATPDNLAGHVVVVDTYASLALPLTLSNASDAAHDLAANEYIHLMVAFKRASV